MERKDYVVLLRRAIKKDYLRKVTLIADDINDLDKEEISTSDLISRLLQHVFSRKDSHLQLIEKLLLQYFEVHQPIILKFDMPS